MIQSGDNPRAQSPMRRVLGNFGFLVRGRIVAALMSFGATALMARALGPTEFGLADTPSGVSRSDPELESGQQ